ncbi:putative Zn-binding protein involved in type VI secretion [Pedobacter cryoconitis]|uniref:Putative Zn-binding protein involved in type VI secretion n=1 Tax=Pedobacter cryoconitis TaxID=188932 RepID=A0A7W9DWT9_9SPHI|nr:PAAR domain-containing protein [Pedobacter cryoconitis]MBB5634206.1 putative Zn-binding protein involved in type VI secretion [Pedobacter cryoconitis]
MGKPAARMLLDKGAHTGPILSGSPNVSIGGKPAARQGDLVACAIHGGPGSIIEGCPTVLINGKPAARMGDKTDCATPPAPAPAGPVAAKDQFHYLTPVKESNPDGTVKTIHPDNLTIKVANLYANEKDTNKDGQIDYLEAGAVMVEFNAKGDYVPKDGKYGKYGGGGGFSAFKAESKNTNINTAQGSSVISEGKASVLSGNADFHLGKEGTLYHKSEGKGDLLYAEGKADGQVFTGANNKYGFQTEVSGDFGAAKAEYEGQLDILSILNVKAKAGAKAGGAAAGGKIGGYVDTENLAISANVGAELALLLGLEVDLDVTISLKPIWDGLKNFMNGPMEGTILSGCPTVLIG